MNKRVLGQSVNTRNPNKLNPESLGYNKTLKSPVRSESVAVKMVKGRQGERVRYSS